MTKEYAPQNQTLVNKQHQFSCPQCGSATAYQIGTKQLSCQSCGYHENIDENTATIDELPLAEALKIIRLKPLQDSEQTVTCDHCGASSKWDIYSLSDLCPYCKTPIAKFDTADNRLQIEAIVPFSVEKSVALKGFAVWLKKRWFAPNVLKEMAGHSKQFDGIYIPHWTFDSLTYTDYRGQRGEDYTEYVTRTRMVNGKMVSERVPITRTRWYAAAGQVRLMFDDILVLAFMQIPKTIINRLSPWRLEQAKPYTPEYLAGLKSKYYQLDLGQAFKIAQDKMVTDIIRAIRYDIGGDHQRIHQKHTRYQNSTYKLMLLPVWYSAFEYKGKMYKTVINGQTGKVSGQYPKSPAKIAIAVIIALIILGIFSYLWFQQSRPY